MRSEKKYNWTFLVLSRDGRNDNIADFQCCGRRSKECRPQKGVVGLFTGRKILLQGRGDGNEVSRKEEKAGVPMVVAGEKEDEEQGEGGGVNSV